MEYMNLILIGESTNVKSIVRQDDLFQSIAILVYICVEVCTKANHIDFRF
jgi:hypothetical protein